MNSLIKVGGGAERRADAGDYDFDEAGSGSPRLMNSVAQEWTEAKRQGRAERPSTRCEETAWISARTGAARARTAYLLMMERRTPNLRTSHTACRYNPLRG
jgi:hypothetical protein